VARCVLFDINQLPTNLRLHDAYQVTTLRFGQAHERETEIVFAFLSPTTRLATESFGLVAFEQAVESACCLPIGTAAGAPERDDERIGSG